jgi:hypothetical protein
MISINMANSIGKCHVLKKPAKIVCCKKIETINIYPDPNKAINNPIKTIFSTILLKCIYNR